jgi:hypothetical protein
MPAALPIDWEEARRAAETGAPLRFVAEKFGASFDAVRQRSLREKWLIPSRVEALREKQRAALIKSAGNPVMSQPVADPLKATPSQLPAVTATATEAAPVTAESLAIMGESLRSTVLQKTLAALRKARLEDLPIESWGDAKTAVEVGLKVSGLESQVSGPSLNVLFASAPSPLVEIDASQSVPRGTNDVSEKPDIL